MSLCITSNFPVQILQPWDKYLDETHSDLLIKANQRSEPKKEANIKHGYVLRVKSHFRVFLMAFPGFWNRIYTFVDYQYNTSLIDWT